MLHTTSSAVFCQPRRPISRAAAAPRAARATRLAPRCRAAPDGRDAGLAQAAAAALAAATLAAFSGAAVSAEPLSPPAPAPRVATPLQPPLASDRHLSARVAPLRRAPPLADSSASGLAKAQPGAFREPQELALTADDTVGPDRHWIIKVLEIGGLNVLGVLGVQQLVRMASDTASPVTLVTVRVALRETEHGGGVRARLDQMRNMAMAGSEGLWLAVEETVNEINKRKNSVAYAEAGAAYFNSQAAAVDAFRRAAAEEAARAGQEEAAHVTHGQPEACAADWEGGRKKPGPLQSLFGAKTVDDGCQEMVVVTLVMTARGVLDVPAITNWPTLRRALQQVSGVSRTSIIACELLWSPDAAADFLSADDVRQDYPSMIDLATGRPVGGEAIGQGAAAAAASG